MELWRKIEQAIEILDTVAKWSRPVSMLFSGGKDSLVLLYLLQYSKLKDYNVVYVEVTGNTHELCTRYVCYVVRKLGLEDRLVVAKARY